MTLCYKHGGNFHTIFDTDDPKTSNVCGSIRMQEPNCWEWQVRHRKGAFDVQNSRYRPSLVRSGYANHREKALRQVTDYIKSGDWDA